MTPIAATYEQGAPQPLIMQWQRAAHGQTPCAATLSLWQWLTASDFKNHSTCHNANTFKASFPPMVLAHLGGPELSYDTAPPHFLKSIIINFAHSIFSTSFRSVSQMELNSGEIGNVPKKNWQA